MTNTELQMIGINGSVFNAASEEQRVCWAKHNTTGGVGLCDAAALWLKSHIAGVGVVTEYGLLACCGSVATNDLCAVYRLSPDYKPPVNRWWFLPTGCGTFKTPQIEESATKPNTNWLEVTAVYAAYLQAKPDGEWELRKPEVGDVFVGYAFVGAFHELVWNEKNEEGNDKKTPYRWCKPRKVAGWVEYPVVVHGDYYHVEGLNVGIIRLHIAADRVGFGGVQYDGQEDERQWFTGTNAGIYPDGQIAKYSFDDCDDDAAPAIPVRARFWEVTQ